jgi:hypothetical protein
MDAPVLKLSRGMRARGFDIHAIRPSAAPEGWRLRAAVTLNAGEQIVRLASVSRQKWQYFGRNLCADDPKFHE